MLRNFLHLQNFNALGFRQWWVLKWLELYFLYLVLILYICSLICLLTFLLTFLEVCPIYWSPQGHSNIKTTPSEMHEIKSQKTCAEAIKYVCPWRLALDLTHITFSTRIKNFLIKKCICASYWGINYTFHQFALNVGAFLKINPETSGRQGPKNYLFSRLTSDI